jgi:hypothetical protein
MADPPTKSRLATLYSIGFVVAAGLSILMLVTDTNLQTKFGTVSSGYYSQWYVVLATAVADLGGAAVLLTLRSRTSVKLGVLGSGALVALFLGVIFTYASAGFGSATQFADYLFGITYFGGDIRYLYDALLATYIVTFASGVVGLAATRAARAPTPAADDGNPSST